MANPQEYYNVVFSIDNDTIATLKILARTKLEAIAKGAQIVKTGNPNSSNINTIYCARDIEI